MVRKIRAVVRLGYSPWWRAGAPIVPEAQEGRSTGAHVSESPSRFVLHFSLFEFLRSDVTLGANASEKYQSLAIPLLQAPGSQ